MSDKKEDKGKTQDILTAVFIIIVFIAVISGIFVKLANITYEIEKTANQTKIYQKAILLNQQKQYKKMIQKKKRIHQKKLQKKNNLKS